MKCTIDSLCDMCPKMFIIGAFIDPKVGMLTLTQSYCERASRASIVCAIFGQRDTQAANAWFISLLSVTNVTIGFEFSCLPYFFIAPFSAIPKLAPF